MEIEHSHTEYFASPVMKLPGKLFREGKVLKLAQLSDLHMRGFLERHERLVEAIRSYEPDLVLITGDTLGPSQESRASAARLVRALACDSPVYISRGNWDVEWTSRRVEFERLAAHWGARALVNTSCTVETPAGRVRLIGVDDLTVGWPDLGLVLAQAEDRTDYSLLLSHSPLAAPMLPADAPVDLVLSGHTHGGQIRVPWLWRRVLDSAYVPYAQGLYNFRWGHMYVNKGFGTVGLPLRLACPAEVAFFEIGDRAQRA